MAEACQVLFPEACAEALQEHQRLLVIQLAQDGHLLRLCQIRLTLLLAAHRQVAGSDGMQHGTHSRALCLGAATVGDVWCPLCCLLLLRSRWNGSLAQLPPVHNSGLHAVIIRLPLRHLCSCHRLHNRSLQHSNRHSGLRKPGWTLGTRRYFRLRKRLYAAPKHQSSGSKAGLLLCACVAPLMDLKPIKWESQRGPCVI